MPRSLVFQTCCVAWLVSATALADAPSTSAKAEADRLFDEAHVFLEAGDWDNACQRFRDSMRLDSSVSTQMNIARCHEHAGKLVEAWEAYNRARVLNLDTPGDKRRVELDTYSEKAIAELAKRLPRLRVVVRDAPTGVTILRDGVVVVKGSAGEVFPINPGDSKIEIRALGHETVVEVVTGKEGETREIVVSLKRMAPRPTPIPTRSPSPAPPVVPEVVKSVEEPDAGSRAWAWSVGAIGVVSAAAGVGLAALSFGARAELADNCSEGDGTFQCPSSTYTADDVDGLVRDANGGLAGAIVLWTVGAAGITAGLWGVLTASDETAAETGLWVGPGGATWRLRF